MRQKQGWGRDALGEGGRIVSKTGNHRRRHRNMEEYGMFAQGLAPARFLYI